MTDMWTCPSCGRSFASRNQSHTCAALGDLDRHFARAGPQVRAAFDAALACVRAVGPVQVLAEKTRIALQVRMSFAAFMPRRDWLNGHLVLARRIDSPRFLRIEHVLTAQRGARVPAVPAGRGGRRVRRVAGRGLPGRRPGAPAPPAVARWPPGYLMATALAGEPIPPGAFSGALTRNIS